MIDFNSEPYNDDFDENNKFYKILFRPSFAVQARELTQLQSILQNQIRSQGNHLFKQGAMVIPGQMSIDKNYHYIKLQAVTNGTVVDTYVSNLEGKRVKGSSGIEAEVLKVTLTTNADPTTLYVRYITAGTDTVSKVFAVNEIITTTDSAYTVQAIGLNATGIGSAAIIKRGVYYVNGYFVLCDDQTILLDKYTNLPSYRVGLSITESKITPEDADYEMLLDNAQNSYNYAAPGAHRYFIDLILTKLAPDSVDDTDFIELSRVSLGQTLREVRTTEYSVLEKTFARRTYDESGDYTVRPFEIDVREHRDNNRLQWAASTLYQLDDVVTNGGRIYVAKNTGTSITTPPTHTSSTAYDGPSSTGINWEYNEHPYYNRGIYKPEAGGNESKLAIGLEPGKAYVNGYELEKISTEYVTIDKARDSVQTDNSLIPATLGSYVLVTNVNSMPVFDTYETIDLYDTLTVSRGVSSGTKVGTARCRGIEWDNGTIGSHNAIYKLFLFDVKMVGSFNFNRNVSSFFYNNSAGGAVKDFSADINPIPIQLVGSVTGSSTTITGTGTKFVEQLVVGDIVLLDTQLRKVVTITSNQSIVVNSVPSPAVTGVIIKRVVTEIKEPSNSALLYPLPFSSIKSVRSVTATNDTTYTVMGKFTGTTTSGGTLIVSTTSGSFASAADSDNYLAVDDTTGEIVAPISITPSGSSVTMEFGVGYASRSFIVSGTVNKTGSVGTEKSKTIVSATVIFTTLAAASAKILSLGKADCVNIVSIKMKSGSFATPGSTYSIDIHDRYIFDDGQRDSYYDYGRLTLQSSFAAPSAPIEVVFEYFSHSPGDYFTVNSYPATISYSKIPMYQGVYLRDLFDFRPRINDAGLLFSGTGASLTGMPKRGIDIRADFCYYLARKDKIALDFSGKFFAVRGVSSLSPGLPPDPVLSMVLYNLTLAPYTLNTSSSQVRTKKLENKRYTMRDIGKLENRIDNLEYYTSLSLLEQETASLKIPDSDGLDRFKNGFIVDNFSGHNIGDVLSPDYMCAIDMEKNELRPYFSMDNINLIEKNSNNTQREINDNYKLYGDVITIKLNSIQPHVAMITQAFASRTEFVNPFAIFTFLGNVKINPSSDDWFEIKRAPDILRNEEGNFDTVLVAAQKSNTLGTVWNAWQTQWTGAPEVTAGFYTTGREWANTRALNEGATYIARADFDARFGVKGGSAPARQVRSQITSTKTGQARIGVETKIVAKIDTKTVDDRIISTAVIPYMRSRNVLIQTLCLKPLTRFYAFFDNVDISSMCTPASKITYTVSSGIFNTDTNVGGLSTETARRVNGDSQVCLNMGDVITGSTSNATAIVVGKEYNPDTNTRALFVQNIIGTFTASELITGSLSNAVGTVTSVLVNTLGSSLISNFNGDLNLLYNIPNTDAVRFRTGTREFKLVDVPTAEGAFTSRGRINYSANGVIETKQATVVSTRNAELVQNIVSDNKVVVQTSERVVSDTGWYDPLAQTFLVESKGGAFLSKVDIFFASKDPSIPVSLEIREVINGYPGKRVLPFSRVTLKPEQVNLSATNVTVDGVLYPKYDTPTTFTFTSPVYVQDNQEYCLVLLSDSNMHKVWISQLGDVIPDSTRTISEQPYAGVLFKSQNGTAWTANQDQDLKFTIWRAKFDTSVNSTVRFVNDVIPYETLESNPLQTKTGSTTVRVWHTDHNMPINSTVILANTDTSAVLGIPYSELYKSHVISNVDLDSYTITTTTAATSDGYGGGKTVRSTKNIQFDAIQPAVQIQTFSDTITSFGLKTTSGKSVDGAQSAYALDTESINCLINENNLAETPRMIASEINETTLLGGNKSLTLTINMSTTNDALSPMIDTHRLSAILVSNKLNSPTEATTNIASLDNNVLFTGATGTFNFSGSTITSLHATIRPLMHSVLIGTYITIASATTAGNNGTFLVTRMSDDGTTGIITVSDKTFVSEAAVSGTSLTARTLFFDEIAPVGSSTHSKYVSKDISLAQPSSYLRIRMAANIPDEANIDLYFKTSVAGAVNDLNNTIWTVFKPDDTIVKVANGNKSFYDITYSKTDIIPFDTVAVKLVMKSINSAAVPRVKDLRIIACA